MNEAGVRKTVIDQELKKRGWDIANKNKVVEEFHMETRLKCDGFSEPGHAYHTKNEFADYLLLDRDETTPLAIVEAKRTSKNPMVGQGQAKGYAKAIQTLYGVDPFIFLTNGENIIFWDHLRYPPRKIYGYFDQRDLERIKHIRNNAAPDPSRFEVNPDIAGRDYQIEAIKRIGAQLALKRRKFLLIMATGTGKTRTAMALIDILLRAKWVNRVLFMADRKVLRDQAYGPKGFQGFFTESMTKIKSAEFDQKQSLYAATIQTMDELYKNISPGFFDLIVMDECHRSIYNKWKDVLSYFDAIQIGLTATPSESIERDTFRFFECEDSTPTFTYTYKQAIDDKILVPFFPYHAKTSFQIKGIKSGELPPEIKEKLSAEGRTEDELDFEGTDFERKFTNLASLEAMVKEFMDLCIKDDAGVLPGKTIYFAMSKAHAYRIQAIFDRLYPQYKGNLARVIVSEDTRALLTLKDFENQDFPRIAISVDMLDTGVDVLEVVNLVFAKPVFSKIKFWQMMGRGTRILDPSAIKPWCTEKTNFLIIDHWSNFEYFNLKPEGEVPSVQVSLPTKLFQARVQKLKALKDPSNTEYQDTVRELRQSIAALPNDDITVRDHKDELDRVRSDLFWEHSDLDYLQKTIAPLMRCTTDVNYDIFSFLLKCEQLALAFLKHDDKTLDTISQSMRDDLRALPWTLNVIKTHEALLLHASSDAFWINIDLEKIALLRRDVAPLMKYRQARTNQIVELDMDDKIVERHWVLFGPNGEGEYVDKYRANVEKHVLTLAESDQSLKKLKAGQAVSDAELEKLEETLNSPDLYITEDNLRKVYQQPQGTFRQFVMHMFGQFQFPSREQLIANAFDVYVGEKNYNADQIRFIRIVKNVLLERARKHERLALPDLYTGSFESLGTDAADRLFKPEELQELLDYFNRWVA